MKNLQQLASYCLKCQKPQCVEFCPAGNNIPQIMQLLTIGQEEEAAKILYQSNNLPFICGSLCDHERQCEGHCILNKRNKPVAIGEIESALGRKYLNTFQNAANKKVHVAVIGAGAAGISATIELIKNGIEVDLYDQNMMIGGVLIESLPEFRYNTETIKQIEEWLISNSVKIYYNKKLGYNLTLDDLNHYSYIIIACGTAVSKQYLNSDKILQAVDVLKEVKQNGKIIQNEKILVIGAGNVACDVARTVKKMGNDVSIVYRRNIESAPASKSELKACIEEQINFIECLSPIDVILDDKKIIGLKTQKMQLIDTGSNRLSFQATDEFLFLGASMIIESLGTMPDYEYLKYNLPTFFDTDGKLKPDYNDINQRILLAGDYLTGASSFAEAMISGKTTAQIIIRRTSQ